jgi:serine/threonine protein kinase
MAVSPLAEALVQLARKRRILDRAGCARLRILLADRSVTTVPDARRFLERARLLPLGPVQQLLEHLPPEDDLRFGPYRVHTHLADGGMGSVWLASHDGSTDLVVVKTMKGQFAANDEVRHRFERECRYMQELKHPHVVTILDHGAADDGTLYMVLRFIASGDLKELVEVQGPLPEALALAYIHQVADVLALAHTRKLIHRDIKPANIFADPEGICHLADFGIARSTADTRTMLTMQGALVGSPYYMSPEQVIAESDLDIRSDLYALGCVLHFCLAGTDPFKGKLQEVLHAHRTAPIPEIQKQRPEITARTAAIIQRCLQKKRDDRYADPGQMRAALAEALAALGTGGEALPPPSAHANDQTITCDLNAQASNESHPTVTLQPDHDTAATIAASLAPEASTPAPADPGATVAVASVEWAGTAGERLDGDLGTALDAPWLALAGDGCTVLLYARRQIVLGKLCEPPVDVCLRKHPIAQFRDDCLRISRQHLRLAYDAATSRVLLTDLGSGNGTRYAGAPMAPNAVQAVEPGAAHEVQVAGALTLHLRALPRRQQPYTALAGAGTADPDAPCGLACAHACDSVVLTRPDNRPGMAYALVLRRITLGGSDADLPLPGASGPAAELALWHGRWIWRPAGLSAWRPVLNGATLSAAGRSLTARPGGYEVFQGE